MPLPQITKTNSILFDHKDIFKEYCIEFYKLQEPVYKNNCVKQAEFELGKTISDARLADWIIATRHQTTYSKFEKLRARAGVKDRRRHKNGKLSGTIVVNPRKIVSEAKKQNPTANAIEQVISTLFENSITQFYNSIIHARQPTKDATFEQRLEVAKLPQPTKHIRSTSDFIKDATFEQRLEVAKLCHEDPTLKPLFGL